MRTVPAGPATGRGPLQRAWPVEDWTALITGRLDGCVQNDDGSWLVEEFKSAYLPGAGSVLDSHQRQLRIYCHLWRRMGNPPVSGSLVYVDLATGEEFAVAVPAMKRPWSGNCARGCDELLAIWRAEAKIREQKAAAAAAMPFPHTIPRPGQQQMMDAIGKSLKSGRTFDDRSAHRVGQDCGEPLSGADARAGDGAAGGVSDAEDPATKDGGGAFSAH